MRERWNRNKHCEFGPNKCSAKAVWRYETMGGGWFYMCAIHGDPHQKISQHITDGCASCGMWIEQPRSGRRRRLCRTCDPIKNALRPGHIEGAL